MFLIYNAWLFVRLVEQGMPANVDEEFPKGRDITRKMLERRTLFGKKIDGKPLAMATWYAESSGYITHYEQTKSKGKDVLEVTPKGAIFATYMGLIDKIVRTFSWMLQFIAIGISLIALFISFK